MFAFFVLFIFMYGLGYSCTRFLKNVDVDTHIVRVAVGLASIPVLGLILDRLHIPIDWKIILGISLIVPLADIVRNWSLRKAACSCGKGVLNPKLLLLLGLVLANMIIYYGGALKYPWLEDTDSWYHAAGVKYVALEKNVDVPVGMFQYINIYPPGYDILMGVLHQLTGSVSWTLKFFNSLLVSLGFLFFYVFVKRLSNNDKTAVWAAVFLFCIPCYLSHFIWAHTLVVTLFFPAFYLLQAAEEDRRYVFPAVIVVAALWLTQPEQPIKFLFMAGILCAAYFFAQRKCPKRMLAALTGGILLSVALWWGNVFVMTVQGKAALTVSDNSADGLKNWPVGDLEQMKDKAKIVFAAKSGSATQRIPWDTYLFPPKRNLINNPVGIGAGLVLLSLAGLGMTLTGFSKKKENNIYYLTVWGWLLFCFVGLNSSTFRLPVGLFSFRFWMLLAIPVTILAADAMTGISQIIKTAKRRTQFALVVLIAVGLTSLSQKIHSNISEWPFFSGVYGTYEEELAETKGYLWLKMNLPPDTAVYSFIRNFYVIGYDMRADFWNAGYQRDLKEAFDTDLDALRAALLKNRYQYLFIGHSAKLFYGADRYKEKINLLKQDSRFMLVYEDQGVFTFRVQ